MASIPTSQPEHVLPQQGAATPAGTVAVDRSLLIRAVVWNMGMLAAVGVGLGLLLFRDGQMLDSAAAPYYVAGFGCAAAAMILTIWLHGRFAATHMPGATSHAVSARLTGLLAAGMGVKIALLVIGFFALKQFPLGAEPAKFSDLTIFAVTFAGAALLCQMCTALRLARSLGRPATN